MSAEWSHSQPRSTPKPKPLGTVWPRPPSRSRASSMTTRSPAAARSRVAAMPAAPAPTTATSYSPPLSVIVEGIVVISRSLKPTATIMLDPACLLYTSDAADDLLYVDLGG